MAYVTIPSFYPDTSFAGNDLIPFWRTADGSMFKIEYNDLYNQLDASIGGAGATAWQGLTKTADNSIGLGGTITQTTDVCMGSNVLTFNAQTGSQHAFWAMNQDNNMEFKSQNLSTSKYTRIYINDQDLAIEAFNGDIAGVDKNAKAIYLNLNDASGIQIVDRDSSQGLYYKDDYSTWAGNNLRWLPDAEWVHSTIDSCAGTPNLQEVTEVGAVSLVPSVIFRSVQCNSTGEAIAFDAGTTNLDRGIRFNGRNALTASSTTSTGNNLLQINAGTEFLDGVVIGNSGNAKFKVLTLNNEYKSKVVYYDNATGELTYDDPSFGGSSGIPGNFGEIVYSDGNGDPCVGPFNIFNVEVSTLISHFALSVGEFKFRTNGVNRNSQMFLQSGHEIDNPSYIIRAVPDSGASTVTYLFVGNGTNGGGGGVVELRNTYANIGCASTNTTASLYAGASLITVTSTSDKGKVDFTDVSIFNIPLLDKAQTAHQLYYNTTLGTITYDVSTGGGGGGLWTEGANNEIYYNDGSVGIGTTSPAEKLEINGRIKIGSTNPVILEENTTSTGGNLALGGTARGAYYGMRIGTTTHATLQSSATFSGIYWDDVNEWGFSCAKNGNMNLHYNGVVALSTGDAFVDISGDLRVDNGSVSSPSLTFNNDTDTGFYRALSGEIRVASNGAEDFRFASGGTFHADADVIAYSTTISDIRLKTKIAPLSNKDALDSILSLNAIEFEYKRKLGVKHFGFIAQEVQKILPDIVTENILIKEDDKKYLTLHQEELIPYLSAGMKEQQKQIDSLKAENKELKDKIDKIFENLNLE